MDEVIKTSENGTHTLERLKSGRYVIKCEGRVMSRHGEYKTLEDAQERWGCYKYA